MSNPFRRKINAEPELSQSSISTTPAAGTSQPLSINTAARAEKHVRIASPPDTKISPASYPSSPEFARLTPSPQGTIVPYPPDEPFSKHGGDPFSVVDSDNDEDRLASEALRNTRLNIASTRAFPAQISVPAKQEDAVQNTLSKFASRPKNGDSQAIEPVAASAKQETKRQTMDVDAFTRLLLTGGSTPTQSTSGPLNPSSSRLPNALSESSSTADSASISHQSIFETIPPPGVTESPRTSHELDEIDSAAMRRFSPSREVSESMKKPPPAPKPRRGKSIKQAPSSHEGVVKMPSSVDSAHLSSDLNKPLPQAPSSDSSRRGSVASVVGSDPSMQIKRPPTPPLSRRTSQGPNKPVTTRNSPPLHSTTSVSQPPASSLAASSAVKPPPPPPSRRISQRLLETTSSSNISAAPDERDPESPDLSKPVFPKLIRTASQATRASIISENTPPPPPPPPPRRHRGSSNASQRPSLGMTPSADSGHNSIEVPQTKGFEEARKISDGSSRDILKDLAALQAEVDALRRQGLRE